MSKSISLHVGLLQHNDNWSYYIGSDEKSKLIGKKSQNRESAEKRLLCEIDQIKNQYDAQTEIEVIREDKVIKTV